MTTKDMDLECYGINLETADKENYQRMVSIPTELIEKALELTGKTMEDMEEISEETDKYNEHSIRVFSYPKLYAYLLSPEFIEKYEKHTKQDMHYIDTKKDLYRLFGQAIGEYQSKDENLLVSLLSKI